MIHSRIFILLIPLLLWPADSCEVTYLSNEGFLLEFNNKKILTDALFGTIQGDWCDSPTPETVQLMSEALAPFNDIDIISISHQHVDHFDAEIVLEHLTHNQRATAICPNQVYSILASKPGFNRVKNRVIAITPELYSDSTIIVSGIDIRVLRLEHSHYEITDSATGKTKNKHASIENLGFVFRDKNLAIYHCGDTNPLNREEYQSYVLENENLDLALLERQFFAAGKTGKDIINTLIQPKQIILMHIQPGNIDLFKQFAEPIETLTVFENKFDHKSFTLKP